MKVAAVWDAKERGSKSLLSNQDALLSLQQEVDTLNCTLREQRAANKQERRLEEEGGERWIRRVRK